MASVADQDVRLRTHEPREGRRRRGSRTHSFEIPVDYFLFVHIDQPPSYIFKLPHSCCRQCQATMRTSEKGHTSPNRFTSACTFTNSLIFPFSIHSDTMTNRFSDTVTPNSGSTFG